jgi:NAD+ diphosphatase
MSPLPAAYLSPLHLPFNTEALAGRLQPELPDADPGGEGVWLLLRGNELAFVEEAGQCRLPQGALAPELAAAAAAAIYLGRWDGRPCRALSLGREQAFPAALQVESLLASEPRIDIDLLSLAGRASQMLHWEQNSRACSRCGAALQRLPGESGKRCRGCGYAHFPHIHPCVIVLIHRPGEILLARKAEWPAGRYGLVAGFLDGGECFEEAVAREVLEETGVRVREIAYVGSQCWPFPSQVMAGFVAAWDGGEVVVDRTELEDARWFPLDRLPQLPPRRIIARYLIDHWVAQGG